MNQINRQTDQPSDGETSTSLEGVSVVGREVGFNSNGNRLKGYLHLPPGDGPFPCMVDNHGSQTPPGTSDVSHPQTAAVMMGWGYAYFHPNRAGYGNSEGAPLSEEVPAERGTTEHDDQITSRLKRECDDVIAALDYLQNESDIIGGRVGVMGSSLGGILSLLASARDSRWRCAVDFSGGASQWAGHPKCRNMLMETVENINVPVFLIQPENDFNTAPTRVLSKMFSELGKPYKARIYPSWGINAPEAHRFCATGPQIWGPDVRAFLTQHL